MKLFTVLWFCGEGSNDVDYGPEVIGLYSSKEQMVEKLTQFMIEDMQAADSSSFSEEELKAMSFEDLEEEYGACMYCDFVIKELEVDSEVDLNA